jgi:hypothetical protein
MDVTKAKAFDVLIEKQAETLDAWELDRYSYQALDDGME